jgi:hypothetical protein
MRKKRLIAFSLVIGLLALCATLQINSASITSAQDAKLKQDGFINGCSDSVIDALNECIQERFSKADKMFGITRVETSTNHIMSFQPVTEEEREVVSELELGGWRVVFYLAGRRVLGPKPEHKLPYGGYRGFGGPIMIAPQTPQHSEIRMPALDDLWEHAREAMLSFDSKNQYNFSVGKWIVTARPIRAQESCLRCHNSFKYETTTPVAHAPSPTPLKVGDALGIAMYAHITPTKSNNVKIP